VKWRGSGSGKGVRGGRGWWTRVLSQLGRGVKLANVDGGFNDVEIPEESELIGESVVGLRSGR